MKRRCCVWLMAGLAMAALAGCASRIPMRRTLPEWVHSLFVPMFENETAEPGLEELGMRFTAEEFLMDGRVEVADKADADLVLRVTITDYANSVDKFSSDMFAEGSQLMVAARVQLFEPGSKDTAFANLGTVMALHKFTSDPRRTDVEIEPDARAQLMRRLGQAVVERVIVGYSPKMRRKYDETTFFRFPGENRTGKSGEKKADFPLGQ